MTLVIKSMAYRRNMKILQQRASSKINGSGIENIRHGVNARNRGMAAT